MTILQTRLGFDPWLSPGQRRLPGTMPLPLDQIVLVDDAFGPQMTERARLMAAQRDQVLACLPQAEAAAGEALDLILSVLPAQGYLVNGAQITRPDGVRVDVQRAAPLETISALVQADACLLTKPDGGSEHLLTGATLCFPAWWTLAQKIGQPMTRIHRPVASYDPDMAARVQRMLDLMRPLAPLWRVNLLRHCDPTLFRPALEGETIHKRSGDYLRTERQVLVKLPGGAVLFLIHTAMLHRSTLSPDQMAALRQMAIF